MINKIYQYISSFVLWRYFLVFMSKITLKKLFKKQISTDSLQDLIMQIEIEKQDSVLVFAVSDTYSLIYWIIHIFTGSKFGHCGILYPKHARMAVHMTEKGVTVEHLYDILSRYNKVCIAKYSLEQWQIDMVTKRIDEIVDGRTEYDYRQEIDPSKLYCSEFIWYAMRGFWNGFLIDIMGRKAFTPDNCIENGVIVYEL